MQRNNELIYIAVTTTELTATFDVVVSISTLWRITFANRHHRLVGLVVRRPPRERKIPGSNPACAGIFSGSSHTSDLNIGTPVGYPARRLAL